MTSLKFEVDKLDFNKLETVPTGLNSLKCKVDKLNVDKLVPVPLDLSKLCEVVKSKIKDIEDKRPDITNLATNGTLNGIINEVENEIPGITNFTTTPAINAKINENKNKIANITNLVTNTALAVVENKIPDHKKYSLLQNLIG